MVDDAERASRHAGPGDARLKGGVVMVIGRAAHMLTVLAAVGSVTASLLGGTAATVSAQSLAEEPPGCWGPNGVDPDCLGPGPYGHGEWGPPPATSGPGPMVNPGYPDPESPGPAVTASGYRGE